MRYLWTRRSLPFVVILSFTYSEAEDDFTAFISAEPTAGRNTHAALAVLLDTAKQCEGFFGGLLYAPKQTSDCAVHSPLSAMSDSRAACKHLSQR